MATDKESLTARFWAMRFNDNKHLGLGDVRLTLWEQEQIEKEFAELEARCAELKAALNDAIESIEDWAGYASEYFRQKHGLAEEVARLKALTEGGDHG